MKRIVVGHLTVGSPARGDQPGTLDVYRLVRTCPDGGDERPGLLACKTPVTCEKVSDSAPEAVEARPRQVQGCVQIAPSAPVIVV